MNGKFVALVGIGEQAIAQYVTMGRMSLRSTSLAGLLVVTSMSMSLAWSTGCGSAEAESIERRPKGGAKGSPNDPGFGGNPGVDGAADGGTVEPDDTDYCSGAESSFPVPGEGRCTGDLASQYFRFAACSCTTLAISGKIRTGAMNSTAGTSNDEGASIAANGDLLLTGNGGVGGSMYAAGVGMKKSDPKVVMTGTTTVKHDAWSGGNIVTNGTHTVSGDGHVDGAIFGEGFSVEGKLYTPSGQSLPGSAGSVAGPVNVPPPCACERKLDIAAAVDGYKKKNDNASIGLGEDALANGGALTLPCGRYHLSKVGGAVALKVEGHVVLSVDTEIAISGGMKIDVAPGADIDIFVRGDFTLSGNAQFGSLTAPSKVRVYTGARFAMSSIAEIGGNIYAPSSDIALSSLFKMSGSMFANRLLFSGGFDVTYDQAILDVKGCEAPGGACTSCSDCPAATPACKGGTCGACATSADCCAPLKCQAGACVAVVN